MIDYFFINVFMSMRIEHINDNGIEKKKCGKCQIYKPLDIFGYSKGDWDNLRNTCKECLKQYNAKNKEQRTIYNKEYWQRTMEEQKEKSKIWRENNKEKHKGMNKKWREENKEYIREKDKKYREANWEKIKERNNIWRRKNYEDLKTNTNRINEFAEQKIKSNTSRRIRELLNETTNGKTDRTIKYIGTDLSKFRIHLESKFMDGMHWKNYGINVNGEQKNVWHIDHILPCASFNLQNPVELMACFHYKNLRPLWWNKNIEKKDTYEFEKKLIYMNIFIETYIIP